MGSKIKGILFDKDGTLIDFYEVWGTALGPVLTKVMELYHLEEQQELREKILNKLGVHGDVIDPEGSFAWKTYEMIAQDIWMVLQEFDKNREFDARRIQECLVSNFHQEIVVNRQAFPVFTNMPAMVSRLNHMNIQTGLATTDEYEASIACMKKLGIKDSLSFYGTADGKMPVKPDKELLLKAARQWKLQPSEIAVVGDTPNDMRFAKNAGAVAIGVLSGTGKENDLKIAADYIIASVDELIPLIEHLNESHEGGTINVQDRIK